jgi:hypothetical protein
MATTENLLNLRIHKLTQAQYDTAKDNGNLNNNELYLTPFELISSGTTELTDGAEWPQGNNSMIYFVLE